MGFKEFKYGGTKTRKTTDETEKCEFYFLCIPVCAFFKYSFPLFIELFFGPLFSSGRACLRTLIFISLFRHCMLSVERHINQIGGHFVKVNRQAVCQSSRKGGNLWCVSLLILGRRLRLFIGEKMETERSLECFVHPSSLSSCPLIGAFFQKYFKLTSASLKFYFGVTALVFSFCLCLDHYHRYHQDLSKFVLHKEIV